MNSQAHLTDLPTELFQTIAEHLSLADILSLRQTCRQIQHLALERLTDILETEDKHTNVHFLVTPLGFNLLQGFISLMRIPRLRAPVIHIAFNFFSPPSVAQIEDGTPFSSEEYCHVWKNLEPRQQDTYRDMLQAQAHFETSGEALRELTNAFRAFQTLHFENLVAITFTHDLDSRFVMHGRQVLLTALGMQIELDDEDEYSSLIGVDSYLEEIDSPTEMKVHRDLVLAMTAIHQSHFRKYMVEVSLPLLAYRLNGSEPPRQKWDEGVWAGMDLFAVESVTLSECRHALDTTPSRELYAGFLEAAMNISRLEIQGSKERGRLPLFLDLPKERAFPVYGWLNSLQINGLCLQTPAQNRIADVLVAHRPTLTCLMITDVVLDYDSSSWSPIFGVLREMPALTALDIGCLFQRDVGPSVKVFNRAGNEWDTYIRGRRLVVEFLEFLGNGAVSIIGGGREEMEEMEEDDGSRDEWPFGIPCVVFPVRENEFADDDRDWDGNEAEALLEDLNQSEDDGGGWKWPADRGVDDEDEE